MAYGKKRIACRNCRVVLWATGNVGSCARCRTIGHPDLELVGVHVHSGLLPDWAEERA